MSDEAHVHLRGYVNKKNCRIVGSKNSKMIIENPFYPQRLFLMSAHVNRMTLVADGSWYG